VTRALLKMSVIAVLALSVSAPPVMAGAGALDTSYGQAGVAVADFGTFNNGTVVDKATGLGMAVLPDGRVVVVGTGFDPTGATTDIVTARFTGDGALDSTWGSGGKAQFDFGKSETGDGAVLQPDGKLLVVGDTMGTGGNSDVLVTRIATNGTLDPTFGSNGVIHPDFEDYEFGRAIALQPDGKIVIVGYTPNGSLVARVTSTGTSDPTFGPERRSPASRSRSPRTAPSTSSARSRRPPDRMTSSSRTSTAPSPRTPDTISAGTIRRRQSRTFLVVCTSSAVSRMSTERTISRSSA
jgi:uncharacterized delta-60 repeat protein